MFTPLPHCWSTCGRCYTSNGNHINMRSSAVQISPLRSNFQSFTFQITYHSMAALHCTLQSWIYQDSFCISLIVKGHADVIKACSVLRPQKQTDTSFEWRANLLHTHYPYWVFKQPSSWLRSRLPRRYGYTQGDWEALQSMSIAVVWLAPITEWISGVREVFGRRCLPSFWFGRQWSLCFDFIGSKLACFREPLVMVAGTLNDIIK